MAPHPSSSSGLTGGPICDVALRSDVGGPVKPDHDDPAGDPYCGAGRVVVPMPAMRMAPRVLRAWPATAVAALGLLVFMLTALAAVAQDFKFPAFTNYVVDQAGVLSPDAEAALVARLKSFQERTGKQLAVATVSSLQGTSVEDYGNRLFREWKLGDKEKNDGALLLVAPNERKVRIEVGYGLEGDLTDAVSRLIIENAILPRFKAGDFAGGISRGADDVMAVFSGQAEDFKQRAAERREAANDDAAIVAFMTIAMFVLFFYILMRNARTTGARRRGPWIIGGPGYGGGWSGGGGGWSGGGGGGGFGGGGGGSSGGGGASGSW